MMKRFFTFLTLVAAALTLSVGSSRASHIVGMDLTYQYTGNPNEYLVTLKFYRDCAGITVPTQVSICYKSTSLGIQSNITIPQVSGPVQVPTNPCLPPQGPTTCQGGSAYGVEEYVYQGTLQLPQAATDWKFIYTDCCRNAAVDNLSAGGGAGIYIEALMDNLNFPTNSSPYFNQIPVTQFCVCNQFFFDNKAIDPDGDPMQYSLTDALEGSCAASTACLYSPGFSGQQPVTVCAGAPPTAIDPNFGVIAMTPGAQETDVICILVEEFDSLSGVKKGHVRRDIQVNISGNCIIQNPQFISSVIQTPNGPVDKAVLAFCLDSSVIIPLTEQIQCGSIAADGSDFRALRPNNQPNPIFKAEPVNCFSGVTDSVRIYFYKPLTHGITKVWTKLGTDNNTLLTDCGTPMSEYDTINVVVVDSTLDILKVQDSAACVFNQLIIDLPIQVWCYSIAADGSDFTVVDAAGVTYNVVSAQGTGCSPFVDYTQQLVLNLQNPVSGTPPYYVILKTGTDNHTISNECDKMLAIGDTVAIITTYSNVPVALGTDISQCDGLASPVLDAGSFGPFFGYQWFLNGTLLPDTTQTIVATQPGNYTVVVGTGPTCNGSDTINVAFISAPPSPNLTDLFTCPSDPFGTWDAGNPGSTYQWLFNGSTVATSQTYQPTTAGTYIIAVSNGNCTTYDTADAVIQQSITIDIGADITICEDGQVVYDAGAGFSAYAWSNGATTQTITATAGGTYYCEVTSATGCKGSDTAVVTVEAFLPAPEVICAASGNSAFQFIFEWNVVTGATSYEVSIDGGLTWTAPNTPNGPTSHGVTSNPASFQVRALGTLGNSCPGKDGSAYCEIIIPNVVTPNGDGLNDTFFIKNLEQFDNAHIELYNRWGNKIYSSDAYKNDYSFKDEPDGVYYYVLSVPQKDPYTGNITVIREKK